MSKDKMKRRVEEVRDVLNTAMSYEPKAREAAMVLDKIFALHESRTVDARDYLTGDSVADAAMLRAIDIDIAEDSPFTFEEVLDFLSEIATSLVGVTSIVMLFF